ncbi:MAG TPA: ATP-dependent RNA helicase HrpA [Chthoniobacterales bacterium]
MCSRDAKHGRRTPALPGTESPESKIENRKSKISSSRGNITALLRDMSTIRYPAELPITARREEILALLRGHQVVVVAGETGSGKTTQLPKMCLEAGLAERGRIGCTQPRRVAALSVSRRVAEELGVAWGREVGCKMRFNDDTGRATRIKFMTDGILLAEIQSDPMLRAYSALIIDEAHERSLNIDFLLGYLQGLLRKRPDLKLIITSATIDTQAFSDAFGGAPIVEVSGRLWPVEVRYAPVESFAESEDDPSHIEAAARVTEDALIESDIGDVLVFMPTERDIRETRELLEGSLGAGTEVIGLFGRMPAAEQQRIFTPGPRRRIIVATNIAETSLTLPRIRYVIDAGFSRMSRYNPRTRTKRLPVEAISQSSANQRAGRAGRVQDGICIRLYSADDFEKRPRFTQPEIQRANLAEVILRMKAFRLGEIETFPFLNPPQIAAIRAGYKLLHELGALNDTNDLTPLGRELAQLPVDPTLGRMLLQARQEKALPEMLIIAAGLSVPDPRERPEDEKEAATAAHRAFADPDSDFLSLLKIWRASPDAEIRGSNNALRRFCKANYLSVSRMREWRDIYRQLADAMDDSATPTTAPTQEASYEAIHRSVLAGLLGQVAQRQERNTYKASGERVVTLFPGSNLYERREKPRKKGIPLPTPAKQANSADKSSQPQWLVSGEIVQTSQLFARMVAKIDPLWIVELGAHLCQFRYVEPRWSAKAGRVLVWERVLLHGLEISRRQIDFGRVSSVEATELFIRGALVAEEARIPLRFFAENRKVRDKVETAFTRVRSRRVEDLDEALYRFYAARIEGVSSVHDLNQLVRSRIGREPDFLCATEADLIGEDDTAFDRDMFPDQVSFGNTVLPVTYAYTPGHDADGVTVRVPLPVAEQLTTGQLHWIVPGLREEQAGVLLRALPKSIRKTLLPLEPKTREIANEFQPGREDFLVAFAEFLRRRYGASVRVEDWPSQSLPPHLKPRVEVVDARNKTIAAGRDLASIQAQMEGGDVRSAAWEKAARRWEQRAVAGWSFGDLPETVVVEEVAGVPVLAFPGLALRDAEVDVRLFRKREEAERVSASGVRGLAELALKRDLGWLRKDLTGLARQVHGQIRQTNGFHQALNQMSVQLHAPAAVFASPELIEETALKHIIDHALRLAPVFPLAEARFLTMIEAAQRELPALAHRTGEWLKQILDLRRKILILPKRYAGLEQDLQRLVPADFLIRTSQDQLPHLVRYLRAIQIRAERAALSPAKDTEKARQLAPFADWETRVPAAQRESFRWMLEEFRVSVFAQELGTAQPVSAQRLKALGGF